MSEIKRETFKCSIQWVDRVFQRLTEIYGEKFTGKFSKPEYMELEKERWRSGLYGLSGQEVKFVLNLCLNSKIKEPPNVIEFYHYGKQWKQPDPEPKPTTVAAKETQQLYMNKIRDILKNGNRDQFALSTTTERQ